MTAAESSRQLHEQHQKKSAATQGRTMAKAKAKQPYASKDHVPLARLHLNTSNPRFEPVGSEPEVIAQLFKEESVLAVARDIADRGEISPLELIAVVEMPDNRGHYTVAEGNRRVCALKVLQDPNKAPDLETRQIIKDLAKDKSLPTTLPVVIFEDEAAARQWIELRHMGAQDGVGTRQWSSPQKTRFAGDSSPNTLSLALLDRAELLQWITADQRKKIPITTLTRYLSNPVVRSRLGIGGRGQLIYTHDADEVDAALRQFILDALPGSDGSSPRLHSRTNVSQREEYGESLSRRGVAPMTRQPTPAPPPQPPSPAVTRQQRRLQNPDNRQLAIPRDFVVRTRDTVLLRLLVESRTLKPDDGHPYAANYVVRAVIERIMVMYAKKRNVFKSGMDDHVLVLACHKELIKEGIAARTLHLMAVAGSRDSSEHSLKSLGSAVHGGHVPTRRGLVRTWDSWQPILQLMLDRL
jgi:hypothetical protein